MYFAGIRTEKHDERWVNVKARLFSDEMSKGDRTFFCMGNIHVMETGHRKFTFVDEYAFINKLVKDENITTPGALKVCRCLKESNRLMLF